MTPRPPLNELLALFRATLAREGVTTDDGAATGDSIVDAGLIGIGDNSFFTMLMIVYPGDFNLVDSMDITGFNNGTGEVLLSSAYKGVAAAIPAGVPYKIVTFRFVPAEVAALTAALAAHEAAQLASRGEVTSIEAKLDGVSGLAALKAVVDAILEDTGTTLPATLTAIVNYLDTEIADILADVTGIAGAAMRGTDGAATTADGWDAALATILDNFTAARIGYLNQLDFDLQEAIALQATLAKQNRQLDRMVKWSAGKVQVQIDAAGATVGLPTITIENLPDGATIVEAHLMFKFRMIENKYAGVNKLNGATVALNSQVFQIQDDGGGAWTDAIELVDDFFTLASEVREGGDVLVGEPNVGVANVVDGNDIYNVRLLLGKADQDFINFDDCQVGLDILYSL